MNVQTVDLSVRHMARGLSTQPEHLRLPGQLEIANNIKLSIRTGIEKRPGTEYVQTISGTGSIDLGLHSIIRDASEQYLVVYGDGVLSVVDLANSATVISPTINGDSQTYLDLNSAAAADFRFLTVTDTTYIANSTVSLSGAGALSYTVSGSFATYDELTATTPAIGTYWRVTDNSGSHPTASTGVAYYQYVGGEGETPGTPATLVGPSPGTDWNSPTDWYDDASGSRKVGGLRVMLARTDLTDTSLSFTFATSRVSKTGAFTNMESDDSYIEITGGTGWGQTSAGVGGANSCVDGIDAAVGWYKCRKIDNDTIEVAANGASNTLPGSDQVDVDIGRVAKVFEGRLNSVASRSSMTAIASSLLDNAIGTSEYGFTDTNAARNANASISDPNVAIAPASFLLTYTSGRFRMTSPYIGAQSEFIALDGPLAVSRPSGWSNDVSYAGTTGDNGPAPFEVFGYTSPTATAVGTGSEGDIDIDDRWSAVAAPGDSGSSPDATVMPQLLTRDTLGPATFSVNPGVWDARLAGDSESNPLPTPWQDGEEIGDMFFFRNRWGFVAGPRIVMSRDNDLFNFFLEDPTSRSDSDPIDVLPSSTVVSSLQRVAPQRDTLVIMSPAQQFEISAGSGALTQSTVNVSPSTSTPFSDLQPDQLSSYLYFIDNTAGGSSLYEYLFDEASLASVTSDVSKHIEGTLPAGVTRVAACPLTNMIFVVKRGTAKIHVLHQWWEGNRKVQTAWSTWIMPGNVQDVAVVNCTLYAIIETSSGSRVLEKIVLQDEQPTTGANIVAHADHRIHFASGTGTYNGGTGRTSFTITPYTEADVDGVLVLSGGDEGTYVTKDAASSGSTLEVSGDYSAAVVVACKRFTMTAGLTRPFIYDGNENPKLDTHIEARHLFLRYEEAGDFGVDVTDDFGRSNTYQFTPADITTDEGTLEVWVAADADQCDVQASSSTALPLRFTGIQWKVGIVERPR